MEKNIVISPDFWGASKEYNHTNDRQGFKPYVGIFQSELKFMCGLAARWGNTETGGELYGLFTHAGRPVIMLATPPGPNAIHQVAQFRQDINFFEKINNFIRDYFCLHFLGNFHSHHRLGLEGPTLRDTQSSNTIASKNGLRCLTQFIITFEDVQTEQRVEGSRLTKLYGKVKPRPASHNQATCTRIHAFLYPDPANKGPVRCPVKVIPGTSPFRRAILHNSLFPELTKHFTCRMESVRVDSFEKQQKESDRDHDLPERLSRQWQEIPQEVQENGRASFTEGLIVLSLPLPPHEGTILVAYCDKPPHRIEGVYLIQSGRADNPINVSKEVLCHGPYTRLAWIYERVFRLVARLPHARQSDLPKDSGEKAEANRNE